MRIVRIAQAAVRIRILERAAPELIDELIVFAREHIVQKTQAERPIVRKGHRFLTLPVGVFGIGIRKHGQIALAVAGGGLAGQRQHLEARRIVRIALHPHDRGRVVAVDLRRIPPRRVVVVERLGARAKWSPPSALKLPGGSSAAT